MGTLTTNPNRKIQYIIQQQSIGNGFIYDPRGTINKLGLSKGHTRQWEMEKELNKEL